MMYTAALMRTSELRTVVSKEVHPHVTGPFQIADLDQRAVNRKRRGAIIAGMVECETEPLQSEETGRKRSDVRQLPLRPSPATSFQSTL